MKALIRLPLFCMLALALFAAPAAFAIDNCQRCEGVIQPGPILSMGCQTPPRGELGSQYCFMDQIDEDTWYCYEEGYSCCVTGPMY